MAKDLVFDHYNFLILKKTIKHLPNRTKNSSTLNSMNKTLLTLKCSYPQQYLMTAGWHNVS